MVSKMWLFIKTAKLKIKWSFEQAHISLPGGLALHSMPGRQLSMDTGLPPFFHLPPPAHAPALSSPQPPPSPHSSHAHKVGTRCYKHTDLTLLSLSEAVLTCLSVHLFIIFFCSFHIFVLSESRHCYIFPIWFATVMLVTLCFYRQHLMALRENSNSLTIIFCLQLQLII